MMDREIRHYNVGGFVFGLEVCAPYSFMEYTEPVLERIRRAAAGELYPVLPTRAGDEVPPRTLFQRREELPESRTGFSLALSQYEPFRTGDGKDSMFTLSVQSPGPELSSEGETIVLNIDDTLPSYTIGRIGFDGCAVSGREALLNVKDLRPLKHYQGENPDLETGRIALRGITWKSKAKTVITHGTGQHEALSTKKISIVDKSKAWPKGVAVATDLFPTWELKQ